MKVRARLDLKSEYRHQDSGVLDEQTLKHGMRRLEVATGRMGSSLASGDQISASGVHTNADISVTSEEINHLLRLEQMQHLRRLRSLKEAKIRNERARELALTRQRYMAEQVKAATEVLAAAGLPTRSQSCLGKSPMLSPKLDKPRKSSTVPSGPLRMTTKPLYVDSEGNDSSAPPSPTIVTTSVGNRGLARAASNELMTKAHSTARCADPSVMEIVDFAAVCLSFRS